MAYQILNGHLNPRLQCVPLRSDEEPELIYSKVQDGLEFAFDPNSMCLLQIDSVQDFIDLRKNPPSPYIMAKYKPHFQRGAGTPNIKTMVLEACHDCNLGCSYCFVRNAYADHGTGNYMTFKTARSAIDRLLNPRERLSVGFFGGEPLLNMKLIREVTDYLENLTINFGPVCKVCGGSGQSRGAVCQGCRGLGKQPPSMHVTTNGTLYTEKTLRFLADHGYSLITSIDGGSEAHDALRPMKRSGRGSHQQIMDGLARLGKIAPELAKVNTLRSTFTAIPGETIRERVEFLNQICDDGKASWVSVEAAAMSEATCFVPNQFELEIHIGNVWDRFYDEYMDTADWWIERAKSGKQPRFHNFHKSLERVFWAVHAGSECFSGDTEVSLLDGTERRMDELVGLPDQWFYSHHQGRVIPTQGQVVKTGRKELMEVELDNGEKLRVTEDHEWMVRNGSYLRTDQLQPGTSLMPLYRKVGEDRWSEYEMVYDPGFDSWEFTHRRVADETNKGAVLDMDSESFIFGEEKQFGTFVLNHKVVSIRHTGVVEDTYCVKVDHDCHNFALTAGVFVHNCGAGAGYASVNAKGEIFGCHRESNSYLGTLVTGIDPKLRQPWLDNRIYTRIGCNSCGHRFACGGGCREDSQADTGNIHEPSSVHCALKEIWIRSAFKIMASLPKQTIARFCAEPGGRSVNRTFQEFLPEESLARDESGIVIPKWVDNIPQIALVREGIDPTKEIPVLQDAPTDHFVVPSDYNPAGPVAVPSVNLLR